MGCRVSQLYSCGVYDSRQMWPILPHSAYGPLYPTYKFLEAIGSKPKVVAHSSVDPGRKTSPSSASDSTGRAGNNAVFSTLWDFPGGASGKEPSCQCRRCKRRGFDSWVGRSSGGGHSNPLQYSCLENLMDRGAWQAGYSP